MFRGLPLLVLTVGVLASRRPGRQPIISEAQQRRICADLCRSGLGGEPCGEVCFDLMPTGIPLRLQSPNDTTDVKDVNTRSDACPVLCENRLGYPLCQCPLVPLSKRQQKHFRADFHQICDYYCVHQSWLLRGCPGCTNASARQDGPRALFLQDGDVKMSKMVNIPGIGTSFQAVAGAGRSVDWGKWCNSQCSVGNGGSACNCDILPFSLN